MTTTKEEQVAKAVAFKLGGLPACGHECIQGEDMENRRCKSQHRLEQWVCSLPEGHAGSHMACAFFADRYPDRYKNHAHTTWEKES